MQKSDLRNHCAIVQPRLYDSAMVTQITLKTEGPHGFLGSRFLPGTLYEKVAESQSTGMVLD